MIKSLWKMRQEPFHNATIQLIKPDQPSSATFYFSSSHRVYHIMLLSQAFSRIYVLFSSILLPRWNSGHFSPPPPPPPFRWVRLCLSKAEISSFCPGSSLACSGELWTTSKRNTAVVIVVVGLLIVHIIQGTWYTPDQVPLLPAGMIFFLQI